MKIGLLDTLVFITFIAGVIAVSVYASRRERNHEDYFLAGRNLKWWVIGISLIASCLSTEQLAGINGRGGPGSRRVDLARPSHGGSDRSDNGLPVKAGSFPSYWAVPGRKR